jgi:hypothetical protein
MAKDLAQNTYGLGLELLRAELRMAEDCVNMQMSVSSAILCKSAYGHTCMYVCMYVYISS